MKKYILLGAVGTAVLATILGLLAAYGVGEGYHSYNHATAATCIGLLSTSLLFIGAVYPKEIA